MPFWRRKRKVPPELLSTYNMITSAFPDGIPKDLYYPLLAVLTEEMGDRGVSKVVALVLDTHYVSVLNDVWGVRGELARRSGEIFLPEEKILQVRAALREHGYDDWLKEAP